jgi:hypothetical protein
MAPVRLQKPWLSLDQANVARLGGQLGVYEIADADGRTVLVGYAGGRSRFGLRGELQEQLSRRTAGTCKFRVEVTMAYLTRWKELLMAHRVDFGTLPPENASDEGHLGRLSPH